MIGRIVYLDWITRHMVRQNPEARFVFGDNAERRGYGGQAKDMRGEPNAIGVATKRSPDMSPGSFFSDDNMIDQDILTEDLKKVRSALAEGRTVYVSSAGLGTGLSKLPEKAPGLYLTLWTEFAITMTGTTICPWPLPIGISKEYI